MAMVTLLPLFQQPRALVCNLVAHHAGLHAGDASDPLSSFVVWHSCIRGLAFRPPGAHLALRGSTLGRSERVHELSSGVQPSRTETLLPKQYAISVARSTIGELLAELSFEALTNGFANLLRQGWAVQHRESGDVRE